MAILRLRHIPTPPPLRRLVTGWGNFFARGDITALFIVIGLLLVAPFSLRAAEWPVAMRVIVPGTALSAVLGLILARSRFGEFLALLISSIYGLCLVIFLTAVAYEDGIWAGTYVVFAHIVTWGNDAITGGINPDDLVFTVLVAILFWFLGYNAAWHVFRVDRIWRVIIPPGLILVTNSIFYDGAANIDQYIAVFMFPALLLLARSNLNTQEWRWYDNGIRRPRKLRWQFLWTGALLAFIPILLGASVPTGDVQDRLTAFQEFLHSDPLTKIGEFWNRMFSPVDAIGPATADYYGGDELELGGAIRLGDQEVFWVQSPPTHRYYWRSRVFDIYESGRWRSAADIRLTDPVAPLDILVEQTNARERVEQEFTIVLNATRILYTAPQPLQIDLTTRTDLFYTAPEGDPTRAMSVSVIRPTRVVRRGTSYRAVSLVSTATAAELRAAGTNYPEWVSQLYFYVSPSVTPRTMALAAQIIAAAGATTPYDQAKAIERYLRGNIAYNESIPEPPTGQDPIDWMLFDQREGYCNYYASAMIVMLRSQGIPARMAAGFTQGTYDSERGVFVITERNAHTWVEVYFPGYGWIEFEPTAAQAPLEREGDNNIVPQPVGQPTDTPTPTMTPTATPTVTPSITPTPSGQEGMPSPTALPSLTPTLAPTATATPVILPTQPAPMQPPPDNPLEILFSALSLLCLGGLVLAVLVVAALFLWWWWEWRGLKGLGPVYRAYARLERYARLLGIQLGNRETPEERRNRVIEKLPQSERPVTAITRLYMRERYGPASRNPSQAQHHLQVTERAWPEARRHILRRWLRRRLIFWRREK